LLPHVRGNQSLLYHTQLICSVSKKCVHGSIICITIHVVHVCICVLLSAALCKNLLVVLERTSFNTRQKASFAVLTFLFGEGGWAVFLMKDSAVNH
jgi:hypothetical protein